MLREIKKELVEYISRNTGIDKDTVVKVLRAEEAFFMMQIRKALEKEGRV
ncbi:hypothetical protein [Thermococcus barophilus]|uniref:Uncharacterized protein n=2 Tax=Thermococcus barophilus TaxID=55802 RepID=A0A0S1XDV0_THEBA|nr:hypothetical protein [Thermococcus barophilus]ADT84551.1 hypothetical protein TERMP_01576 [Thermococcus barophilus MP]ALM75896.1 hypothetical protein TBCH5v1_1993 [Thermococcus barophilus]